MHSLKGIIATALLITVGFAMVNALPVPSGTLLRRDGEGDHVTYSDGEYTTSVSSSPYGMASSHSPNNEEEKAQGPYYSAQWTEDGVKNTYFENHAGIATSSKPVEPKNDDRETQIGTTNNAEHKDSQYYKQSIGANANSHYSGSITPKGKAKYGESSSEGVDTTITNEKKDGRTTNEAYNPDGTAISSARPNENDNDNDNDDEYQ